ncbi:MAG: ferritin-like domain-containing protein [Anaerolineales bacterium]|nr:ferritin-like domain-containing protein [Anaerolineales bacterium]
MELNSLKTLFIDQLKDLKDAENQLTKALPKMAKAASSPELQQAFERHLEQTKGHLERVEQVLTEVSGNNRGKKCKAMEGLIEEGAELMKEKAEPEVMDAGLIAAAQKVEHYEIASYGTARTYANLLGMSQAAKTLQQILDEEGQTDKRLTQIAESINVQAMAGDGARR